MPKNCSGFQTEQSQQARREGTIFWFSSAKATSDFAKSSCAESIISVGATSNYDFTKKGPHGVISIDHLSHAGQKQFVEVDIARKIAQTL